MKPLKASWWILLLILCAACATHHRTKFLITSDLEEQCKILNKKRNAPNQKSKVRGKISKVSKIITSPARHLSSKVEESKNEQFVSLNDTEVDVTREQIILTVSQETTITRLSKRKSGTEKITKPDSSQTTEDTFVPIILLETQKPSVTASQKEEYLYLLAASAVATIFLLSFSRGRTRKISTWAAKNPWKTRALITGTHCMTAASAWLIGQELANNQIAIAESSSYAAMVAFTAALILYPIRNSATAYLKRKACDVVLFSCGIVLFAYAGNQNALEQQRSQQGNAIEMSVDTNQVQMLKSETAEKNVLQKIILTILAIGVTIGLLFLLAVLSCNIACSGSGGLAILVAVSGVIGIGHLFILMLRWIFKKSRQEKPEKVQIQKI